MHCFIILQPSWMQVLLNSNAFRLSELLSCILLRSTDFTCLCNLCTFFLLSPFCYFLQRPLNVNPVTKLPFTSWSLSLKLTFFIFSWILFTCLILWMQTCIKKIKRNWTVKNRIFSYWRDANFLNSLFSDVPSYFYLVWLFLFVL